MGILAVIGNACVGYLTFVLPRTQRIWNYSFDQQKNVLSEATCESKICTA